MNLGLLSYFKYSYFLTGFFNSLFGTTYQPVDYLAHWTNYLTGSNLEIAHIILPVGISFYTFQSISYSVDIYRGLIKPVNRFLDFAFFVSFFPQLVAGPIVRATEFVPQIYKPYNLTRPEFNRAIFLILGGLIKKILISDYISSNFVDRVFASPGSYTGFENLMSVYGYTIQIYCDFSGYTDIAIGVALLLGFRLSINFDAPYISQNITEFWRRWHISLSTWLRDYLYISLGGNRKGKVRQYVNLFITMLLGGLWHGAHIKFLIWGALHGVALAIHKLYMQVTGTKGQGQHFPGKILGPAFDLPFRSVLLDLFPRRQPGSGKPGFKPDRLPFRAAAYSANAECLQRSFRADAGCLYHSFHSGAKKTETGKLVRSVAGSGQSGGNCNYYPGALPGKNGRHSAIYLFPVLISPGFTFLPQKR